MPSRWTLEQDTALCLEVFKIRPESLAQWTEIADDLNKRFSRETKFTGRGCRDRTNLLKKKYKQEDRKSLKRSGTEEEVTELMEVLEDIVSYERDCCLIKEAEKLAAIEKRKIEKEAGENLRKAAMERLSKKRRSNERDPDVSVMDDSTYYGDDGEDEVEERLQLAEQENLKPNSPKKTRGTIKSTIQVFALQFEKKAALKAEELEIRRLELEFQRKKWQAEQDERNQRLKLDSEERMALIEVIKKKC